MPNSADPGPARETTLTDRPLHPTGPLHEVKLEAVDETSLQEEVTVDYDGIEAFPRGSCALASADCCTPTSPTPIDRPPHPTGPLYEVKQEAVDEKTSLHQEVTVDHN
ncbi:hypothetical protein FOCC_FOCC007884, partial [Frankliniella occidentalis]